MRKAIPALLLLLFASKAMAFSEVPSTLAYCGMELSIDESARATILETITKLKRSPIYFQSLVDRANIYFPFIEEAFSLRAVPEDLKYIVIMESAFVGDAVSSSNAVGFWQFKEESARESGLRIDQYVDERKHIFMSSLGAAKYFYTIARYFDSYLYAVIGYNRGPVGALPYISIDELGNRKARITKDTHWYALKAIAYKLAFEQELGKTTPPMWLQPMNTHGETNVGKLAQAANLSVEDFKKYNLWIKGSTLPEGHSFIYYLPRQGKQERALMWQVSSGGKQIGGGMPVQPEEKPKPAQTQTRDARRFTYLEPGEDPDHGLEYVHAKKGESLVEISVRHHVRMKKLKDINGFTNSSRLQEGDIVYLKSPNARHYHIVQPGESLLRIAERYGIPTEKLQSKNRMRGTQIFAGQKLSLKKKTEKGAKPVMLAMAVEQVETTPVQEIKATPSTEVGTTAVLADDPGNYRLAPFESKWVTHTAAQGESVWRIAKKYGAFAEVVKKINGLSGNEVKPGTELRILQVTER